MAFPVIRPVGIRVEPPAQASRKVAGVDWPNGILGIDMEWFEKKLCSPQRLMDCENDDELRSLKEQARLYFRLKQLQDMAREHGPHGGA